MVTTHDSAPVWRKSKRCDSNQCVEVARLTDGVALRDSTCPDGPILTFSSYEWADFVADFHDRSPTL